MPLQSECHWASATKLPTLLHSDLDVADDPEFGELITLFVGEMPDRIKVLETQAKSRDWSGLARSAHELKGAAGTYGFGAITPSAARLEAAAGEAQPEERMVSAVDEVVNLCRRIPTASNTDPKLLNVAGAVEALPMLSLSGKAAESEAAAKATGTDGILPSEGASLLAQVIASTTDKSATRQSIPVRTAGRGDECERFQPKAEKPGRHRKKRPFAR